ncbi:MAG: DUF6036 family nucleotidyltransferase [bacterium]
MYSKEQLEKALRLLGKKLELKNSPLFELVVCGGSSLIISGLVSRATKDVDVVAIRKMDEKGNLIFKSPLPVPVILINTARDVAHDLGLQENWLNPGPESLMQVGLPEGFLKRAEERNYGSKLKIFFLGRFDLIHLKVFAGTDQGPGRHVNDLLALKPSEDEMEAAAKWSMKQDPSEGFRYVLNDMLEKLGYGAVCERI